MSMFSVSDDTESNPVLKANLNGEPFTSVAGINKVGKCELKLNTTDAIDNETEIEVDFKIVTK